MIAPLNSACSINGKAFVDLILLRIFIEQGIDQMNKVMSQARKYIPGATDSTLSIIKVEDIMIREFLDRSPQIDVYLNILRKYTFSNIRDRIITMVTSRTKQPLSILVSNFDTLITQREQGSGWTTVSKLVAVTQKVIKAFSYQNTSIVFSGTPSIDIFKPLFTKEHDMKIVIELLKEDKPLQKSYAQYIMWRRKNPF